MSKPREPNAEVESLLAAALDGRLAESDCAVLERLLQQDGDVRESYVEHAILEAMLRWVHAPPLGADAADGADDFPVLESPVIDHHQRGFPVLLSGFPSASSGLSAPLGSFALSYLLAALIVGAGMLAGLAYQVSAPEVPIVAENRQSPLPKGETADPPEIIVGRIAAMEDCRWADARRAPVGFERILLGRTYSLTSGLMEVAYTSGARVILQGPCTYTVDSRDGGFLAVGMLTARIESKVKRDGVKEPNLQISKSPNPKSTLFAVRTPTATVADLGTEFGVAVDPSGASETHVYRGKVEVRTLDDKPGESGKSGGAARVVVLGENESARVEVGKDKVARVVSGSAGPTAFVRRMPKRMPIQVYGTGVGVNMGAADPHWQISASSDDPDHRPRPAVVIVPTDPRWMSNRPDRCQWVSWGLGNAMYMPLATYTFRTKFDLTGLRPSTAVLRGRFAADDHVREVRLNGRPIPLPPHGNQEFSFLRPLTSDGGFVDGVNVLEIDVENWDPQAPVSSNTMGLIVELEGTAVTAWPDRLASDTATNGGKP
jgi:hypothetical protein